jgi:IS5 family transposase
VGIQNARTREVRVVLYRDLLKVTEMTLEYAETAVQELKKLATEAALSLATKLQHFISLALRVVDQTQRRVLRNERVPSHEKIVSIFETHTDIVVKDRREVLYGHKLFLTAGASGLVLDCVITDGSPADSSLATTLIERQISLYGTAPEQVAFDGGFASRENLEDLKKLGVRDVAFSKGRGLSVSEMVASTRIYRKLRNFRAGVESIISFLKRSFGMRRCTWRRLESFKAYSWGSILSSNLLLIARTTLG